MRNPLYRLLIFFLLFIAGNLLAGGVIVAAAMLKGISPQEVMEMLSGGGENMVTDLIRPTVWIQTICTFVIPGLVFGLLFYRGKYGRYLHTDRFPTLAVLFFATLAMLTGYPLVQLAYEANQLLPINEWMTDMEDNAMSMLEEILQMDSIWGLLSTLIIVAVLPAVGEELVFRGIVQKQLGEMFKSEQLGIWLAAAIFSAIHLQFEGFLPRLVLGAILGYLYYWTKSLWVPIIIHFLNNGVQVVVMYISGVDLSQQDPGEETLPWWGSVIAIVLFTLVCFRLVKLVRQQMPYTSEEVISPPDHQGFDGDLTPGPDGK